MSVKKKNIYKYLRTKTKGQGEKNSVRETTASLHTFINVLSMDTSTQAVLINLVLKADSS